MTSVTSPQQTGRGGTDIPGPRGGQGVRLLVLGADADAQDLRDRAVAAGIELAQRYSSRVSHVAYGSGIDPQDTRYARIRAAGLPILPIRDCASQLGLVGPGPEQGETARPGTEVGGGVGAGAAAAVDSGPAVGAGKVADADVAVGAASPELPAQRGLPGPVVDREAGGYGDDPRAADDGDDVADLPPGAAVVGVDPWVGEKGGSGAADAGKDETARDEEAARDESAERAKWEGLAAAAEVSAPAPAPAPDVAPVADLAPVADVASASDPAGAAGDRAPKPRCAGSRCTLVSLAWAMIPLASLGLLTPVAFGYAALRLRSRPLACAALGYTLTVMLAFVLSAARPHAVSPSDTSGALLTLALAGTWVGGTVHAFGLRGRVFAR